jgi:hypothetical protein
LEEGSERRGGVEVVEWRSEWGGGVKERE